MLALFPPRTVASKEIGMLVSLASLADLLKLQAAAAHGTQAQFIAGRLYTINQSSMAQSATTQPADVQHDQTADGAGGATPFRSELRQLPRGKTSAVIAPYSA